MLISQNLKCNVIKKTKTNLFWEFLMHLHKSYMDEDCAFDYVAKVIIFMPWFWCSSNSIMGVLTTVRDGMETEMMHNWTQGWTEECTRCKNPSEKNCSLRIKLACVTALYLTLALVYFSTTVGHAKYQPAFTATTAQLVSVFQSIQKKIYMVIIQRTLQIWKWMNSSAHLEQRVPHGA